MADEKYRLTLEGSDIDEALLRLANYEDEGLVLGSRKGVMLGPGSEYYHKNARYYAELAQSAVPGDTTSAVRWDIDQSALTDADRELARKNIGAAGSNRNLLDNPWFISPVNQRGLTTYSGSGQLKTIDRWFLFNGSGANSLTVQSGYISVKSDSNGFGQFVENSVGTALNGKTVTCSVMFSDGSIASATGIYSNSSLVSLGNGFYIGLNGGKQTIVSYLTGTTAKNIKAMKVELGAISTLANDVPPDYAEELAKCQRYFFRWNSVGSAVPVGFGWGFQPTYARITIPTPVQMRTPITSVSYSGGGWYLMGGAVLAVTNITYAYYTGSGVTINAYASVTQNNTYALICNTSGSYIDISADL